MQQSAQCRSVCGAQHRSMVHNVALYQRSGAQCRFHKPMQTDRWDQSCYFDCLCWSCVMSLQCGKTKLSTPHVLMHRTIWSPMRWHATVYWTVKTFIFSAFQGQGHCSIQCQRSKLTHLALNPKEACPIWSYSCSYIPFLMSSVACP